MSKRMYNIRHHGMAWNEMTEQQRAEQTEDLHPPERVARLERIATKKGTTYGGNKVYLHRERGMWTLHIKSGSYPIVKDTVRMIAVIRAMKVYYPQAVVFLDGNISTNPFVARHIQTLQDYGMTPIYDDIQVMLDHPEEKECNLCHSGAWYNKSVNSWKCANQKCGAHESYLDRGRFFKIRRR